MFLEKKTLLRVITNVNEKEIIYIYTIYVSVKNKIDEVQWIKLYNAALIALIRTIHQYSFWSFNLILIDKNLIILGVFISIALWKNCLHLRDIVPNKTTFTIVDIAFALQPPPPPNQHTIDLPCFIY